MQALKCGDKWVETDRLCTKWNGLPMQNGTPYFWLGEFCEKHDLPFYGLHSFRHLFASLLVNQGVDKNRDGKMTVILDEVQTLNHRKDSILVHILSRVRKLDISVILASQDYLNASLAGGYKYCGTHILFRPLGEECIKAVAELTKLDINTIRALPDFHCAIMGTAYSEYYQKNIQLHSAIIGETYRPSYMGNYEEEQP